MYAIKKPDGEVTYYKNDIIRVVEDFYKDLYISNEQPQIEANEVTREVPNITTEEIKKALKGMKRGKTPRKDGISTDLIIDAGEIARVKQANLFNKCDLDGKTPEARKNATIILIHKRG